MSQSQPVISVQNVKRSFKSNKKKEGLLAALGLLFKPEYQEHEALKGVSFEIEQGSFNGLIGANGAGKTTLLKILSGLIPPSSGEARVMGYNPFERHLDFRHQISLVMGQKAQLWWDLPAVDAFDLLRAIYEIPTSTYKKRLAELASLLDVERMLGTQIRRLSLGERMKMELIGALLHWPKIIFLDEPTIGLDVLAAQNLREFLRTYNQKEKATIILTSHNMDDIERLCSRVLILKSGSLLFDGKPDGLLQDGKCGLRVQFKLDPGMAAVVSTASLTATEVTIADENNEEDEARDDASSNEKASQSYVLNIKKEQIPSVLQKLLSKFELIHMSIEEQSLEQVIGRIYTEERKTRGEVHS